MTNSSVLKVTDLGVSYGAETAITNLNFDIKRGEFVAILGPSGCGKSSLLNVLSGVLPPTRGTVEIENKSLYDGQKTLSPKLGYVFQGHRLLPWRTVKQNLELVLSASDVPREKWDSEIDRLLDILHISRFKDSWPMKLSGGQRQRVSIARALIVNPTYILMDEPLSTLDEVTARTMRMELTAISEQTGATIVFVTHSIREAVYLADRIIILSRGPSVVFEDFTVPLDRPRPYDAPEIGQIEAEIVRRVEESWGIKSLVQLREAV